MEYSGRGRRSGRAHGRSTRKARGGTGPRPRVRRGASGNGCPLVHTDVCVVGAGPAGLLLALLLAKRGADVVLLEAHPTFDRKFRGEILQPSALRLLDQLGLLDVILSQSHVKLTEAVYRINGRYAGSFHWARISLEHPYAVWMPQPL